MLSLKQSEYVVEMWRKRKKLRIERKEARDEVKALYRRYEIARDALRKREREWLVQMQSLPSTQQIAKQLKQPLGVLWAIIDGIR